jgi:septum site-determining protein MinD
MANIIGILSGKGGVGKTTLTLNLGTAFTVMGEKVTIIDGDIKNPNVGLYLGRYTFPRTLNDFLKRGYDIDEVTYTHFGMKIIPSSLTLNDTCIGLSKLRYSLEEKEGYVFVDFPPGLSRDTTNLMEICDSFIIVTNPTIASLAATMRFSNITKEMNKEILGVVVNRSGKKYEVSSDEVQTTITENILAFVPEDENVRKSAMEKKTVIEYRAHSPASLEMMSLAGKLLHREYEKPKLSGLINFVQSIRA